jgi:hypothetical protein
MLLPLAYRPFLDPLPLAPYWYLLALPLCLAVSVVYKSMKCRTIADVPREAGAILAWIIGLFVALALVLAGLVRWLGQ